NTDVNGALGTIFGVYKRSRTGACEDIADELRSDARIMAAGYVMYGPSTALVYSRGDGVHGFTLDHDLGEFLLSHPHMRCPDEGWIVSANVARMAGWGPGERRFVEEMIRTRSDAEPWSLRNAGAMVADLHRCLIQGGLYMYPAEAHRPQGSLRLLYECIPAAFLAVHAGGRASTGSGDVLEVRPTAVHDPCPIIVGSASMVETVEAYVAEH
ncbi:MAG: class 1 fructose-bisphosphatase, partial [Myxococcota bacterium]